MHQCGGGYSLDEAISGNLSLSGAVILDPSTTKVLDSVMSRNNDITSIYAPGVTYYGTSASSYCTNLVSVYIGGNPASPGSYAFRGCSSLKEIRIPYFSRSSGLGGYGLEGCTSLEVLDYGNILTAAFNYLPVCPLHTVILRSTERVVTLSANALNNSTAFQSGGTGGTIYIPEMFYVHLGDGTSLDYRAATNWSVYDGYGTITWAKIEGSEYEL